MFIHTNIYLTTHSGGQMLVNISHIKLPGKFCNEFILNLWQCIPNSSSIASGGGSNTVGAGYPIGIIPLPFSCLGLPESLSRL